MHVSFTVTALNFIASRRDKSCIFLAQEKRPGLDSSTSAQTWVESYGWNLKTSNPTRDTKQLGRSISFHVL
jgi:hypothetical protein